MNVQFIYFRYRTFVMVTVRGTGYQLDQWKKNQAAKALEVWSRRNNQTGFLQSGDFNSID